MLILGVLLNFNPNTSYKYSRFSKILLKKDFKFFSNNENNIITFNLSFILLLIKINLIKKNNAVKRIYL